MSDRRDGKEALYRYFRVGCGMPGEWETAGNLFH